MSLAKQTIDLSNAVRHPPSTPQFSLPSYSGCTFNSAGPGGWIVAVHGMMNFNLQLDSVDGDVDVTFVMEPWDPPLLAARYDVLINGQMLAHRTKDDDDRFKPHTLRIPANMLQVGSNSIVLSVSQHGDGGSSLAMMSITVQSAVSAQPE